MFKSRRWEYRRAVMSVRRRPSEASRKGLDAVEGVSTVSMGRWWTPRCGSARRLARKGWCSGLEHKRFRAKKGRPSDPVGRPKGDSAALGFGSTRRAEQPGVAVRRGKRAAQRSRLRRSALPPSPTVRAQKVASLSSSRLTVPTVAPASAAMSALGAMA